VEYYKYLKVMIAPVDLKFDGWIIESVIDYISLAKEALSPVFYRQILSKRPEVDKKKSQQYYFDKLLISSTSFSISFVSMPYMYKSLEIGSTLSIVFILFGNIGNVRLAFSPLKLEHRHLNLHRLSHELSSFYLNQCKNQLLHILASSDIIGNPNELIDHLRIGVMDLLTLSGDFSVSGLFKGMSSFFHHSIFGASNFIYKFFENAKIGIDTIARTTGKKSGFQCSYVDASGWAAGTNTGSEFCELDGE
jgi:hypothetical protein